LTGEHPKRILLVEDHHALQAGLATVLDLEPTLEVVGRAESLAQAREFLARGEALDVAIIDLTLPDGDGTELIGVLQEAYPDAAVLVLTASIDPVDHARALTAGADEVLSKATPLKKVVDAIRNVRGSR
jgi:DNA-binding NarL/FixJ family response regulator